MRKQLQFSVALIAVVALMVLVALNQRASAPPPAPFKPLPSNPTKIELTAAQRSQHQQSDPTDVTSPRPSSTRRLIRSTSSVAQVPITAAKAAEALASALLFESPEEQLERSGNAMQRAIADLLTQTKSDAGLCESRAVKRREYTHRKKRKNELGTVELSQTVRAEADGCIEFFPSSVQRNGSKPWIESLRLVVNPKPIVLDSSVDLSVPFGSWKASFQNETSTLLNFDAKVDGEGQLTPKPPQIIEVEPNPLVGLFRYGLVHMGHVMSCEGNVYTSGGCLWDSSGIRRAAERHPSSTSTQGSVAIALCDPWCKGYYHFTHEHLPRIALVHQLLTDDNSKAQLVLAHSPNEFQVQFFVDILGIKKSRIVSSSTRAHVAVYPTPQRCGNTMTHLLLLFRSLVFRRLNLPFRDDAGFFSNPRNRMPRRGSSKLLLLFAERSKGSRMPRNYFTIKKRLVSEFGDRLDFNTTLGREHVEYQVRLFHDADIVLGPHGANLANVMFMHPHSHVIEMASYAKGNLCYYSTASRLALRHHLVLHMKGKDDAYELDYVLVADHVRYALKALSV